jgi:ATP synthase protein I
MPSDNKLDKESKPAPSEQGAGGLNRQFAMALELPFVIVSGIVVGGLIGYFLDNWLRTKPYLMLLFGFLGFFAGLRDVLRRVAKQQ